MHGSELVTLSRGPVGRGAPLDVGGDNVYDVTVQVDDGLGGVVTQGAPAVQQDGVFELETRPGDPYSVQLNYVVRDGKLYLDPAEGKRWLDHMRADPRVRVRFGDRIYPATVVLVGEPGELEGFDADRFVYRVDSRSE